MSPHRTLLIVNPLRSPKAGKLLTRIEETLRALGVHCDLEFTQQRGHGIELAARGVAQGYRTIVAVGGDGTVNEVVNGVVGSEVTVFSIPLGAGNDFLRSLGVRSQEEACRVLATGRVTNIDLGLAEYRDDDGRLRSRHYAVLADAGFGSEVVRNTPRRLRHALGGSLGYVISVYRTARERGHLAQRTRVTVDGELRYDETLVLVEAFNGMYGGGGLKVAPTAKMNDGLLDVFLVRDMSWLQVWGLFPKIYRGTHIEHEKAEYFQGREVEVEAEERIRTSVDGEVIGYTPARFSIVPRALRVRCPPESG
jgi:diacylglycerol kinase (ATP)